MGRARYKRTTLLIWTMGAMLLAGCGDTRENAIRELALTATAAAPAPAPTSRGGFVATPAALRTGSAVAGGPNPTGTDLSHSAPTGGGTTPGRAAEAHAIARPNATAPRPNMTAPAPANATPRASAAAATGTGGGPRSSLPSSPVPGLFTDAGGRYSFRVPSKWRGQKSTNTAVEIEVVSDAPTAYLRTVSQTTTVPVTLDGATSVIVNSLRKTVGSFEEAPGDTREAMIGGQRAKRIEYFGTDNGTRLRYVTYVIVYNQKLVVSLFFIAQPGDLDEVLTQGAVVLNTFSFT